MESSLNTSDCADIGQSLASERRASTRVLCDLETTCQPIGRALTSAWSARVLDISKGGIALVLGRRFEPGVMLSVHLASPDGETTRTLFLRVVHVTHHGDGSWRLGCAFASELIDEELQAFQAERVRPPEEDCRAWVRFACDVETQYRAVAPAASETWPARVTEVSPGGMKLLTPCRLDTGAILSVDLPGGTKALPRQAFVRVLRNHLFGPDEWMTACEFTEQLSDDDLLGFQ